MSSFAEQLAARAAKRTGSDSAPTSSIPSPSRRIIGEKNNNNGSSTIGSSPSRTAASLSEQIKSRAVDRNNSGGRSKSGDDNGRAEKKSTTATTDEALKSSTQQIIQKQSPLAIKKSLSSSKRTNNNPSGSKVSAAKVTSSSQQRRRADDLDSLFNETNTNDESTSYIPAKLHATKSRSPSPQIPSSTSESSTTTSSPEQTKLKAKLDKYKSENKKLRHESLLLKAKLEEMASLLTKLQQLESGHKVENEELKVRVGELTQKNLQLEMSKLNNGGEEDDEYEWNGIRSSIRKLREERSVQQQRRASLTTTTTTTEEGRMSALSVDTFAEMDKEDLVAENVRLTQLMLDMEGLDELQKLANAQNGGSNYGGKNGRNDTSSGGGDEEKDAAISALNKKVSQIEDELTEVTELKNAEIDVLRKQLNRVEQQQHNRNNNSNNNNNNSPQDATANMEQQQQQWNKEREELREEIRRLNLEVSRQMSNRLDQEEEDDNARYNGTSSSSSTSLFITSPKNLDNSDISSLQSIIGMMRQTIDQSTKEKEELEQRLAEEQERSQNELKAFAKTLEGVDDLRKSAETMSREIRRIKVKGYRPTRSDLMGGGGDLNGVRNFGELTAAVEASENMEDAIRLIEGQNDALEERRRMGVVAASQSHAGVGATNAAAPAPQARKGSIGLRAITEDDNDEGGFLSFWNGAGRTTNDDEEDDNDNDGIAKREKKKKSKRKKKRDDEGSVFTSFF